MYDALPIVLCSANPYYLYTDNVCVARNPLNYPYEVLTAKIISKVYFEVIIAL